MILIKLIEIRQLFLHATFLSAIEIVSAVYIGIAFSTSYLNSNTNLSIKSFQHLQFS